MGGTGGARAIHHHPSAPSAETDRTVRVPGSGQVDAPRRVPPVGVKQRLVDDDLVALAVTLDQRAADAAQRHTVAKPQWRMPIDEYLVPDDVPNRHDVGEALRSLVDDRPTGPRLVERVHGANVHRPRCTALAARGWPGALDATLASP